jgi:hypothetical protein
MIEILEIPVFLTDISLGERYFGAYPQLSLPGYKDCQYITMEIADGATVIFYLLEFKEGQLNTILGDRVIPVAPFCLMLLSGETFVINNFHEIYKERYDTPMVCIYPEKGSDFDLTYVKNVVLKNNKNLLVKFDPESDQIMPPILRQSFQHLINL